jgi:dUTP pyrophosphatase
MQNTMQLMEKELIKVNTQILSTTAKMPTYAHAGDAGADLYASENFLLPAKSSFAVKTGIAMEIPEGYVGYINPRSGMAMKGITVMNAPGTIDSGYRGEIKVILANHTDKDYQITYGDKIAQMVFHKYHEVFFEPVDELSNSERGHGGFGSSGK